MRCPGCGKTVPFGGEVCPYCLRDKSADQQFQIILFIFVLVGGGVGYLVDYMFNRAGRTC